MEKEQQFHFRVRVGEIEVEGTGPEEYVKEIRIYAEHLVSSSLTRMRTMGAVSPQRDAGPTPDAENVRQRAVSQAQPLTKEESIAEFLERLPNRTHQDKILAFAYFLEKNRGVESFGVKEINDCYDEVREAKSNTAQYFTYLLKSALIMKAREQPSGNATQYVLTRTGEATIRESIGVENDA